jgi:hypothetical protein
MEIPLGKLGDRLEYNINQDLQEECSEKLDISVSGYGSKGITCELDNETVAPLKA